MAQYQVNLAFTADTAKAKAQLKDLQNQLTNLINSPQSKLGIEGEIHGAIKAAAELKAHLQAATNVKTGNLDFSKLSQSLKQSNTSLTQYATKLQQLGPAGQQAFMTLAQSVAQAEIPIRRSSAALDKMWETLRNTARWQVSSTILHGFMGAVQSAYGYAQDLDKSLNDIRIVTGQNTEQMAKFAKEANKAAKALSTSTTNYTKASLIYYQQGLTDQQVKERTDITVKMANVTRTSAQDVSDQMTAVWNNFYDGSKSLEHYADVMTALGAATASSTDEISEGLNKFAAVAETVGLSYEYAASALATVTATTRESADVVGNAFKTLFARIQGLKLGETLDDGTTLNKYSTALESVGINIKTVNGDIKDMDDILNELGAKWNTLGKDQQIALAQTVAGVRQYTQLIALMDNWDYFQENLGVANNSAGALQEQADIYAESWEAASKRVEAAAQGIYEKLINDEFFKDLLNSFEKILSFIDNLIDGLGGLKGVLLTLSTLATKLFADKMAQGLTNMVYNVKMMTKSGKEAVQNERKQFINQAVESIPKTADFTTSVEEAQMKNLRERLELQQLLTENTDKMSQTELATNQALMDRVKTMQDLYEQAEQERLKAQDKAGDVMADINKDLAIETKDNFDVYKSRAAQIKERREDIKYLAGVEYDIGEMGAKALAAMQVEGANTVEILTNLQAEMYELGSSDEQLADITNEFIAATVEGQDLESALQDVQARIAALRQLDVDELIGLGVDPQKAEALNKALGAQVKATKEVAGAEANAQKAREDTEKSIKSATGAQKTWADTLVSSANAVAGFASALSMMGGIWDTLQDPDLSGWEKFTTVMTTLGMLIPTMVSAWTALKTVISSETVAKIANAVATWGQVAAEKALNNTKGEGGGLTKENIKKTWQDTKTKLKNSWGKIKEAPGKIASKWNNTALEGGVKKGLFTTTESGGYVTKGGQVLTKDAAAKMAGKNALKGIGGAAATIGVVAIALAGAKKLYEAADKAYRKDEIAAEKAEGVAKRMEEQAEKAKAKYDELKGAIDAYDSSIKSLDDLTEGTVEYADAVTTANERALTLIDTYDELAGQYQVTAEGLIVFNEAALDNLQIMELQKRNAAQAAAIIARQNAREARTQANTTEFLREDINSKNQWSQEDTAIMGKGSAIGLGAGAVAGGAAALSGALAGTKLGTAFGSFAGPIGTAIGAVAGAIIGTAVGAIVGAVNKKEASKNEKKAIDAIYALYDKIGNAALTEENIKKALEGQGITDPALIDSLLANRSALESLMLEMKANTAALQAENVILARNTATSVDKNFENYDNKVQAAILQVAGARRGLVGGRDENQFEASDYRNTFITTGREIGAADKAREYLKDQLGIESDDLKWMNFKKDTITYKYLNKETGKYEKKELDYDDLATWENARIVEQDAKDSYEGIRAAVTGLDDLDKTGGLMDLLGGGDLSALTLSEINELADAYSSGTFDEKFRELGQYTGENYAATVAKAINSWDYDTALSNYSKRTKAEIDNIFATGAEETGLDPRALENYAEVLMKGSSALNTYADEWERLDNEKVAAQIAVSNAKFAKGVVALNDVMDKNIFILQEWNEQSLETWQAVAEVQNALEQTFGLKVSADFVKQNLEKIQELAEGDVTHLEELREAAAKDFILNLDISDASKKQFTSFIDQLTTMAKDSTITVGATIDDAAYIAQLNKMLEAGEITKDEVQSLFASIGYAVDVQTTTRTVKNVSRFQYTDQNGNAYSGTYTTETDMEVPYIAGKDTKTNDPSTAADGSIIGPKKSGSGLTYTGTKDTGAGLLSSVQKEAAGSKKQLDRYHYISRVLEEIEKDYDAIANARERAFGADKLALYDKEILQLEKLRNATQAQADEAKKYYDQDKAALLAGLQGVKLDTEGNIINYDELFAKHGQSDQFEQLVANYEESLDTWKESLQGVIDKNNELLDLKLEKIQYKIDIALQIDDQDQEYLDFLMEMADDPLDNAAQKLSMLTEKIVSSKEAATELGKALSESLALTGWDESEINQLLTGKNIENLLVSNELNETQVKMLEQYREQLYETTRMLMTWADDIKDTVIAAFDELGEAFDESAKKLSHYNTILTTYENIIDIVGKDTLGVTDEMMAQLSRDQVNNAVASLEVAKAAHDTNVQALEDLRNSYNEEWSDDAKKAWDEAIKHAEEKCRESEAEMFSSWESALQAAAEAFEKAVETAVAAYEKAMSGLHGSFDAMQTAYDQQSELNARYIEDYEKIYKLSKLNRQVQNSIDDTDNVKAKKELAKLQKEILAMSESDAEVSAYQIEVLQKQYELKLAQIALEEAQNAKTQVRMQRDTEGNWSYVYTADEGEVENAQQNYEDKLYELQDYHQQYIQEQSDALMQLQQEFAQAMAGIKRENYATEEEYVAALRKTQEYYQTMINYRLEQLGLATTNAKGLYENEWLKYSETTGYKISKDTEWVDSFKETQIAIVGNYKTISDYQDTFKISSEQMIGALTAAYKQWSTDVNTAMNTAGTSVKYFAEDMQAHQKTIADETDKIVYSLEDIATAAQQAFKGVVDAASANFTAYSAKVAEWIAKNLELIASLNAVIEAKTRVANTKTTNPTTTDDITGNLSYYEDDDTPPNTGGGGGGGQGGNTTPPKQYDNEDLGPKVTERDDTSFKYRVGQTVYSKNEQSVYAYNASDGYSSHKDKVTVGGRTVYEPAVKYYHQAYATILDRKAMGSGSNRVNWYKIDTIVQRGSTVKHITPWITGSNLDQFDTGGYTGSWGSNGRLAMLHQKELVLNAADTENMLKTVELVRKIVRVIDLNAAHAANAFGGLTPATPMDTTQVIEQEVTIHAEFPNANNRTEIEEAFNSLLNRASQFANRKK